MNLASFKTAGNVITGSGSVSQVGMEAKQLMASKVLIITDKIIRSTGLLDNILEPLSEAGLIVEVNDNVVPEPPFETLEEMADQIKGEGYDLFIGVGGGSALDIAKLLAVMMTNEEDVRNFIGIDNIPKRGIPFILIPTTSGTGSEVTYNAIFTDTRDMVKKGIVSPYLLPNTAIVDPKLTLTVPPQVTAATGMDALVHAIESYTAGRASELTDGIALHAIKLISKSLRKAVHNGSDLKSREEMAMGSLLAGISLCNAGVGAVHALAYPLGGKFKISHGVSNSLLLPFVMKYNIVSDLEKFAEVAKAMGETTDGLSLRDAAEKSIIAMQKLSIDIGIPQNMKDLGVQESDIPSLAEEASKIDRLLNNNPRKLLLQDIESIYREAYGVTKVAETVL